MSKKKNSGEYKAKSIKHSFRKSNYFMGAHADSNEKENPMEDI